MMQFAVHHLVVNFCVLDVVDVSDGDDRADDLALVVADRRADDIDPDIGAIAALDLALELRMIFAGKRARSGYSPLTTGRPSGWMAFHWP